MTEPSQFTLRVGDYPPLWFSRCLADGTIKPLPGFGTNTWGHDGAMVQTESGEVKASIGDVVTMHDGKLGVQKDSEHGPS